MAVHNHEKLYVLGIQALSSTHVVHLYIHVGKILICKKECLGNIQKNIHSKFTTITSRNMPIQVYDFNLISSTWLFLLPGQTSWNLQPAWLSRASSGVELGKVFTIFASLAPDLGKFFQSYALWVWAGRSTNPLLIDFQLFLLCFYPPPWMIQIYATNFNNAGDRTQCSTHTSHALYWWCPFSVFWEPCGQFPEVDPRIAKTLNAR